MTALIGMLLSLVGLVTLTSMRTITRLRRQAEKVGPYQLVARLGAGAMGVVWEARHALLRRPTAIKLVRADAPTRRPRPLRARGAADGELTHPNTVVIYDYGRALFAPNLRLFRAPSAGAIALEELLEGKGLAKKLAGPELLSGLGARLTRASDLPSPSAPRDPIPDAGARPRSSARGGLPRGGFVELSGRRSCGRFSIGLAALAAATSTGEAAALVDLGGHLDPQSADDAGVDLTRLLWVRPAKLKDAVASAEMLLGGGIPAGRRGPGLAPVRGRFVPDAAWVRLARAARSRRAALLLLAPYDRRRGAPSPPTDRAVGAPASAPSRALTLQKDARAVGHRERLLRACPLPRLVA